MTAAEIDDQLNEATLAFTLGEHDRAVTLLGEITSVAADNFDAWHALAEVQFDARKLKDALRAGEQAAALKPDDIHAQTTLSRICMEMGDKDRAEAHGARARMLGWREQLQEEPEK